ncbi:MULTISPECIES: MlaD family protein [unclassified Mycobacterium]|uniref:MlaD family protein n=1 Tax=unclassified Mycobacterium TaxID=2642494 RepID=UPI0029C8AA5D|nr:MULTISPECIES: MlaD family protein [unclassified Mycobacterium]
MDSVHALRRRRVAVSVGGLVVALLAATTYIVVGSLGINPARSTIDVRVLLQESGGLLPNQDVTLRGVQIGRVKSLGFTPTGVEAVAAIDADVPVPQNSAVRVSSLSAAGEQYLDFRPVDDRGPVLTNGSIVGEKQTAIPVTLARLLGDADGLLAQMDPRKLAAMSDELRVSRDGPEKLAALLDGGAFLITTLDSVLPETVSAIRTSRVMLTTLADVTPGLKDTSQDLHSTFGGINAMDGGFRTLLERGPTPLTLMDNVIADNRDATSQLLGVLPSTAKMLYSRVPALDAFFTFPGGSSFEALGTAFHDGAGWAILDAYPRYMCDYNLPRRPPSVPDYSEPYLYTYCTNPDPSVLVRGARNAPRPPNDEFDLSGPPPGADPLAVTNPTPVGPNTIPTPYGGPQMPLKLPPE